MKKIILTLICIFAMFGLSGCDCLLYMSPCLPPPPPHHHHCEISVPESGISAPEAEVATISTEDASSEATSSVL